MLFIVTFERLIVNPEWETCFSPNFKKYLEENPALETKWLETLLCLVWEEPGVRRGGWDVQATPPRASWAPLPWAGTTQEAGPVLILRDRPVIENVMLTSGLVCFLVTSILVREIHEYLSYDTVWPLEIVTFETAIVDNSKSKISNIFVGFLLNL